MGILSVPTVSMQLHVEVTVPLQSERIDVLHGTKVVKSLANFGG